jgi:arylsulfatase
MTMSDDTKDVLIAAYLFDDLARSDFDQVLKLAEDKVVTVEGVVLVQKDTGGEVHVTETGDHLGRKGAKLGGGVGLAVGLLAPPLLAATAVGAAAGAVSGRFAKHRLESGIGEKMDAALPPGSGGVIAVYDSDGAEAVGKALANAVKTSVAHIDNLSAKQLKAGLAEAQAGMGG